jgi:hypothetical protein
LACRSIRRGNGLYPGYFRQRSNPSRAAPLS